MAPHVLPTLRSSCHVNQEGSFVRGRTVFLSGIAHEELSGSDPVQSGSWRAHEEREDEGAGLRDAQQNRTLETVPGNL